MNLSHRGHVRSTTVWILILVFSGERWWKRLGGMQEFSAIEVRVNGVKFDGVASIDYGR